MRFQYSLRTLFVVVSISAVLSYYGAWFVNGHTRQASMTKVCQWGAHVRYHHEYNAQGDLTNDDPPGPSWLRSILGEHFFSSPHSLDLLITNDPSPVPDEIVDLIGDMEPLQELTLGNHRITEKQMLAICRLHNLRVLDLNFAGVTDVGAKHLGRLSRLNALGLGCSEITNKGVAELQHLTELRTLGISSTELTDDVAPSLSQFDSVRDLGIRRTLITDVGFLQLTKMRNLESIDIGVTSITPAAIETFHEQRLDVEIVTD